jgi:hypothetical protein
MVLLDDVIQVLDGAMPTPAGHLEQFFDIAQ